MSENIKIPWLMIVVWAVIIHVILIVLSILEVLIYSSVINSGHPLEFYEQHAQDSAPYVSIIFGIILFYFIAKKLCKNRFTKRKEIGFTLPIVYIIMDIVILLLAGTNWTEHYVLFIISFATKILASYFGAVSTKEPE